MYERTLRDEESMGVRYQLVSTRNPDAPLRLEIVSCFKFPNFGPTFEASQIPGYFTLSAGSLEKYNNRPGWDSLQCYHFTVFVYEPLSEDGEDVDGGLGHGSTGVGETDGNRDAAQEHGFRHARLSSLYRGSHGVNACMTGISAYRTVVAKTGAIWGLCLVRYPPE